MTWTVVMTLFVGIYVTAAVFDRYRLRDTDPLRERLDELEGRLANALPEGDPYRKKILPMLEPPRERVYCQDCRFKQFSPSSNSDFCLAQPINGNYPHLGQKQTNADHDCTHFQKKTP